MAISLSGVHPAHSRKHKTKRNTGWSGLKKVLAKNTVMYKKMFVFNFFQ